MLQVLILTEKASADLQRSFAVYLFNRSGLKEIEIRQLLESLPGALKKTVMSTLDIFVEKGRKEGLLEGKLEEARNIALAMKQEGMPLEQISKFTKLTVEEIRKLK